jgi:hypothetical protein
MNSNYCGRNNYVQSNSLLVGHLGAAYGVCPMCLGREGGHPWAQVQDPSSEVVSLEPPRAFNIAAKILY